MVLKVGSYWNFHDDCYQHVIELRNNEAYILTRDPGLGDDEIAETGRWHHEWVRIDSVIDFLIHNHMPLLYKPVDSKLGRILYGK